MRYAGFDTDIGAFIESLLGSRRGAMGIQIGSSAIYASEPSYIVNVGIFVADIGAFIESPLGSRRGAMGIQIGSSAIYASEPSYIVNVGIFVAGLTGHLG